MKMFDPDLDFVYSGAILGKPLEFLISDALYPVWESLIFFEVCESFLQEII